VPGEIITNTMEQRTQKQVDIEKWKQWKAEIIN